jgi:hypothetical protein
MLRDKKKEDKATPFPHAWPKLTLMQMEGVLGYVEWETISL